MFKKSKNIQGDLFNSISTQLSTRKQQLLKDPNSWHNIFYKEVVCRIDELPYAALYSHSVGRPNASVRTMIAMMILKEGQGWSDEQMYESCRFDIKIMMALGLFHLDQDVPSESTYYEFRKLLQIHNINESQDLLRDTFLEITTQQVAALQIGGKKIRMDSKLINSSIAKSNRLQLILEATRKYLFSHAELTSAQIDPSLTDLFDKLRTKTTSNISYRLSGTQKDAMLLQLGHLIQWLLSLDPDARDNPDHILSRIFREQYIEEGNEEENEEGNEEDNAQGPNKPTLRPPQEISSGSIQSVHDPDAAHRSKGSGSSKQTVAGYHANITESCDAADGINLILDVEVVPANICEDAFLESAIDHSESILQNAHQSQDAQIEKVITDGGYDSIANRTEMLKAEWPNWELVKTKDGKRIYNITQDTQGQYLFTHLPSDQPCTVTLSRNKKTYAITAPNGSRRYMSPKEIEQYIERQIIESQVDPESYNIRANVESSIHQCFHRLKKRNKIVYRGQIKCQWYVLSRALWVNMTRIAGKKAKNDLIFAMLWLRHSIMAHVHRNGNTANQNFPKIETFLFAV